MLINTWLCESFMASGIPHTFSVIRFDGSQSRFHLFFFFTLHCFVRAIVGFCCWYRFSCCVYFWTQHLPGLVYVIENKTNEKKFFVFFSIKIKSDHILNGVENKKCTSCLHRWATRSDEWIVGNWHTHALKHNTINAYLQEKWSVLNPYPWPCKWKKNNSRRSHCQSRVANNKSD